MDVIDKIAADASLRDDNKSEGSSTPSMERSFENCKELCIHDGTLLKKASAEFMGDLNTSGALKLVQHNSNKLCIEWRPNENILITDEGSSVDQEDWSLVDTIKKRHRTVSESKAFNTKYEGPSKPRCLEVPLSDLKYIEVLSKGQTIRLIKKCDSSVHSEYFFQHGNADMFVKDLQQRKVVARALGHRHLFEVLDADTVKLKKTFEELQIDDIKESGGWLTNVVWKNMEFLAKVSDYVQPQLPQRNPSPNKSEDYELLNQEKSDLDSSKEVQILRQPENRDTTAPVLPQRKITPRGSALTEKQWCEFQTEDGRISDAQRVKEIIFRGGIEDHLRTEVWKYVLNYYLWDDTTAERTERRRLKSTEYYQMKAQWLSMSVAQERNFSGYRDRKCQIEKDVKRTDRTHDFFAGEQNPNIALLQDILMTYVMYNFDLGYVQGMSDLLAPILSVMRNEADTFWCFVGFMDIVFSNFDIDQAGMKRQLNDLNHLIQFCNYELFEYLRDHGSENMYFCFRWLLVWFKREFSAEDIMELWEVLWTGLPCPNFHLFVGVAILDAQMQTIMENKFEFNEILKHVNELSMNIDLWSTLEVAEAIYVQIKESDCLPNEIRVIMGEEPMSKSSELSENENEESFDEIVNELTKEEEEERQRKLDEACDQSMFMSYM